MEKITIIPEMGESIPCLLNPESLVRRRVAGVRPRRSLNGLLTNQGTPDDALLYTGGGTTELTLELLFDTSLDSGKEDVRNMTDPLWALAENSKQGDGVVRSAPVTIQWGGHNLFQREEDPNKLKGIVIAIAERWERFTPDGVPQRSWIRMRLLRVKNSPLPEPPSTTSLPTARQQLISPDVDIPPAQLQTYQTIADGISPEQIAQQVYQDPRLWRPIMSYNNIDDPLHIAAGTTLVIPPKALVAGGA
jgi:hypothetical protein